MTTTPAHDLRENDTINLRALATDYGFESEFETTTDEAPYARVLWTSLEDERENVYVRTDLGSFTVPAWYDVDLGESENWN